MNSATYLKRIQYEGPLAVSLEALAALQQAHLFQVPFENLDIHWGRPIVLELEALYHKVVEQQRGGFCYELNGLFGALLKDLGFEVRMISAQVYDEKAKEFGPAYDHMALLVALEKTTYLVDVGFGEFAAQPLKLVVDEVQNDPRGVYKIQQHDATHYTVSKRTEDHWEVEYLFGTKKQPLSAFEPMCHYQQTSPKSHFTQKKLITRPTANGRITLTGTTLKITKHGQVIQEQLFEAEDYEAYLLEWFGVLG